MPVAVPQTIRAIAIGNTVSQVRDAQKFYGLKPKEKKQKQKSGPWVDLSDEEPSSSTKGQKRSDDKRILVNGKGVKRKAEMLGSENHPHRSHHKPNTSSHDHENQPTKHDQDDGTRKHKKRRRASSRHHEQEAEEITQEQNSQDCDLQPPEADIRPPTQLNGIGNPGINGVGSGSSSKAGLPQSQPQASSSRPRNSQRPPLSTSSVKFKEIQEQRNNLPIAKGKDAIVEQIRRNDVTILIGETGSGKTTQIPQYILSSVSPRGTIAITQPRRVAATSLAARVSLEQNAHLGDIVGYAVRFDEKWSEERTRIKYMTDGMLVREIMVGGEGGTQNGENETQDEEGGTERKEKKWKGGLLEKYSVIIVDEAHERTLRTDLLLAKLKEIQRIRNKKLINGKGKQKAKDGGDDSATAPNPLKLVVMSATLDAEKFSKFFNNAPILYIKGRQHPVKIFHSATPVLDYTDAALRTFFQIHIDQPPGDVLVFLPGQEDIESLAKSMQMFAGQLPVNADGVLICTMFAAQDHTQNNQAFIPAPKGMRKCILATNIAETSITIPGIKYVIDTGKCKEKQYLARATGGGFDTLLTRDISKSSALQRTGRAGREGPGFCFRLYTEQAFNALPASAEPEILRVSLTSTVLNLLCLGEKLDEIDIMDRPDRDSIASSLKTLWILGAIDASKRVTLDGYNMSFFPLEPQYACALVASKSYSSTSAVLDTISILSASSKLFIDISDKREAVEDARRKFRHPSGDHMTVLSVLRAYREVGTSSEAGSGKNKAEKKEWCRKHFLNERALVEAGDIRKQLVEVCRRVGIDPNASIKDTSNEREEDGVLRSFAHGLVANSAFLQPDGSYKQVMGQTVVKVHPGSTLCDKKVPAIIYDDLMYTNQIYARGVSTIPRSFFLSLSAFKQRKA